MCFGNIPFPASISSSVPMPSPPPSPPPSRRSSSNPLHHQRQLSRSPESHFHRNQWLCDRNRQIRAERHTMRPLGRQEFLCVKDQATSGHSSPSRPHPRTGGLHVIDRRAGRRAEELEAWNVLLIMVYYYRLAPLCLVAARIETAKMAHEPTTIAMTARCR